MPLNVLLVGRMAGLMKPLIESLLECDCELREIADLPSLEASPAVRDEADVIVGWPLSAGVAQAKKVRLIQACGAGIEGLPIDLLRPEVIVANTYHHEIAIAEHVLMAMLVLFRRPLEYDQRLRAGDWWDSCIWGQAPHIQVLDGKMALVIGTGHIGREVARRARAFAVNVVGVSRKPQNAPPDFLRIVDYDDWRDLLPEADFVVPCCPLTPETEGLIGATELAMLKPSACVINTARGRIVDELALYEALRHRRIGGAAVDVWYQYPTDPAERKLPSKYPFHELDNVLMTPHVSAWTHRTIEGRARDIAENINRFARGEPLRNVVHGERLRIGRRNRLPKKES
jgi:phosphoglycerate dehydrogenase-like enzyme